MVNTTDDSLKISLQKKSNFINYYSQPGRIKSGVIIEFYWRALAFYNPKYLYEEEIYVENILKTFNIFITLYAMLEENLKKIYKIKNNEKKSYNDNNISNSSSTINIKNNKYNNNNKFNKNKHNLTYQYQLFKII